MEPDDQVVPKQEQTLAQAPGEGQDLGSVSQSSLKVLLDQQIQDGTLQLPPLAPKSIECLITDLVHQGIMQHSALQFHGLPIVAYAGLPYELNQAAVMYITMRLDEVFGPSCTVTPYLQQNNPRHVAFQIKLVQPQSGS